MTYATVWRPLITSLNHELRMLRCVWRLPLSPFPCKDNRSTWRVCRRSCVHAQRDKPALHSVSRFVYVLPACLRPIEKFATGGARARARVCRNSRIDVTNSEPLACHAPLQMKTRVGFLFLSFFLRTKIKTNCD